MTLPASRFPLTVAEFLEFERASAEKHEFVEGEIFAMAGASFEHNVVSSNLLQELGAALRGRPCVALPSDMKVVVEAASAKVYYPDVTVVCGEPRFYDDRHDLLVNPSVIVEVLSDSTERTDRGEKFGNYRLLPSLTDYLLVSFKRARLEHFAAAEGWRPRVVGAGAVLVLRSLDVSLAVDDLWRGIRLEP